jgi:hypothetical protein
MIAAGDTLDRLVDLVDSNVGGSLGDTNRDAAGRTSLRARGTD